MFAQQAGQLDGKADHDQVNAQGEKKYEPEGVEVVQELEEVGFHDVVVDLGHGTTRWRLVGHEQIVHDQLVHRVV